MYGIGCPKLNTPISQQNNNQEIFIKAVMIFSFKCTLSLSSMKLKLVESINKSSNFTVDVRDQFLDLAFRIQELYGLGVRVISHTKWPWNRGSEVNHLLLCALKAVSDKVYRLMLCDGILLCACSFRLKLPQLRFSCHLGKKECNIRCPT